LHHRGALTSVFGLAWQQARFCPPSCIQCLHWRWSCKRSFAVGACLSSLSGVTVVHAIGFRSLCVVQFVSLGGWTSAFRSGKLVVTGLATRSSCCCAFSLFGASACFGGFLQSDGTFGDRCSANSHAFWCVVIESSRYVERAFAACSLAEIAVFADARSAAGGVGRDGWMLCLPTTQTNRLSCVPVGSEGREVVPPSAARVLPAAWPWPFSVPGARDSAVLFFC
jgi:hypothetical protein